jgi:hypothetical protein
MNIRDIIIPTANTAATPSTPTLQKSRAKCPHRRIFAKPNKVLPKSNSRTTHEPLEERDLSGSLALNSVKPRKITEILKDFSSEERRGAEAVSQLLDSLNLLTEAELMAMCEVEFGNGWTLPMIAARYFPPETLSMILNAVGQFPDTRERVLLDMLRKSTSSEGLTLPMVILRYSASPADMLKVIMNEVGKLAPDAQERVLCEIFESRTPAPENWTLPMVVISRPKFTHAPEMLKVIMGAIGKLDLDARERVLRMMLGARTPAVGGWTLPMIAARYNPGAQNIFQEFLGRIEQLMGAGERLRGMFTEMFTAKTSDNWTFPAAVAGHTTNDYTLQIIMDFIGSFDSDESRMEMFEKIFTTELPDGWIVPACDGSGAQDTPLEILSQTGRFNQRPTKPNLDTCTTSTVLRIFSLINQLDEDIRKFILHEMFERKAFFHGWKFLTMRGSSTGLSLPEMVLTAVWNEIDRLGSRDTRVGMLSRADARVETLSRAFTTAKSFDGWTLPMIVARDFSSAIFSKILYIIDAFCLPDTRKRMLQEMLTTRTCDGQTLPMAAAACDYPQTLLDVFKAIDDIRPNIRVKMLEEIFTMQFPGGKILPMTDTVRNDPMVVSKIFDIINSLPEDVSARVREKLFQAKTPSGYTLLMQEVDRGVTYTGDVFLKILNAASKLPQPLLIQTFMAEDTDTNKSFLVLAALHAAGELNEILDVIDGFPPEIRADMLVKIFAAGKNVCDCMASPIYRLMLCRKGTVARILRMIDELDENVRRDMLMTRGVEGTCAGENFLTLIASMAPSAFDQALDMINRFSPESRASMLAEAFTTGKNSRDGLTLPMHVLMHCKKETVARVLRMIDELDENVRRDVLMAQSMVKTYMGGTSFLMLVISKAPNEFDKILDMIDKFPPKARAGVLREMFEVDKNAPDGLTLPMRVLTHCKKETAERVFRIICELDRDIRGDVLAPKAVLTYGRTNVLSLPVAEKVKDDDDDDYSRLLSAFIDAVETSEFDIYTIRDIFLARNGQGETLPFIIKDRPSYATEYNRILRMIKYNARTMPQVTSRF